MNGENTEIYIKELFILVAVPFLKIGSIHFRTPQEL